MLHSIHEFRAVIDPFAAHILAGEADEAERRMRAHVENAQRKIERA